MKKREAEFNFIESIGWWKLCIEDYVKRALEKTAGNLSMAVGVLALRD